MRIRFGYAAVMALVALAPEAIGQERAAPPSEPARVHVLELYTSQGCSSCPAADALLKSFVDRPDTVALSFSVDYWDHLGWKDTLALPKNAKRQRAYAKTLGNGNVYTPQIVIDGTLEAIGSHKAAIEKALLKSAAANGPGLALAARSQGGKIMIEMPGAAPGMSVQSGTVWLAVVSPKVEVKIGHGENRGRMLSYYNVVREMTAVGMWSGKPLKLELPENAMMAPGNRCAVLLQGGEGGRIVAAAWMTP